MEAIADWCSHHADMLDRVRSLFIRDADVTETGKRTTFTEAFSALEPGLEVPDILEGLVPGKSWKDAKNYMARLVCYVWDNFDRHNSINKAIDYIFRIAREGCRLYADCKYSRTLIEKYGRQISTIKKEAKILHAGECHFKKRKWSGMERPPTIAQMAKKSRMEENQQIKREERTKCNTKQNTKNQRRNRNF